MNSVLAVLGLYGYIWRPFFRTGSGTNPYWLVRVYSWFTPLGTATVLGLLIVFWVISQIAGFVSKDAGAGFGGLVGNLRIGLFIAVLAMIPSWLVKHEHISAEAYNSGVYNLMRETSFGETSLLLVQCTDPGQFSCKPIERTNIYLPPEPTPLPTVVKTIEDIEVVLEPNYILTPTPPVEFGIEASSGDLAVRVGNQWRILATPQVDE
ncbi:MAG: hypothetical protein AAGD96_06245 [Chloroflexota bacterium]